MCAENAKENEQARLAQDVVDRLLLAKGLLAGIRFSPAAHPDRVSLARAVLTAHDAAELALAAVARHLGVLSDSPKSFLMDYFPAIAKTHPGEAVAGRDYFSQLNSVRVQIKHKGIFPEPGQWYRVGEVTYGYTSGWCQRYFGFSLGELDESLLIANSEVKELYGKAKDALQKGQFRESLEQLAFAADALFKDNQAFRSLSAGTSRAEDAIKLAAFGVHANDYLALQEFLPHVMHHADGSRKAVWEQGKYGHPGNWRENAAEFSLRTFVGVAVAIQDADWIPGAIEFSNLYQYKITALVDGVEIFREMQSGTFAPQKRVVVKAMQKNDFLLCSTLSRKGGVLANLLSGRNDPLTFVIWGPELTSSGEVEVEKVRVTCVPDQDEFTREHFPELTEIDYAP